MPRSVQVREVKVSRARGFDLSMYTHSLDVKRYGSVYCQFVIVRRAFSFIPVTIEESK